MTIDQIAQVAHELHAAYCKEYGEKDQPSWAYAPEWQKKMTVRNINAYRYNPTLQPRDLHNAWVVQMTLDGWTLGEKRDKSKKEHPGLMEWDHMTIEHRMKDVIFRQIAISLHKEVDESKGEHLSQYLDEDDSKEKTFKP